MIFQKETYFHITTEHLSYLIGIRANKYPETLYFGKRIPGPVDITPLMEKFGSGYGNTVSIGEEEKEMTLDNICLEFSNAGCGDYRIMPMELEFADRSCSTRFFYKEHHIYEGIYQNTELTGMPHARLHEEERTDTLELVLEDQNKGLLLTLVYTAFEKTDVITRRMVLKNELGEAVSIRRLMSMELDLPATDYEWNTFDGLWARERHRNKKELISGTYVNESTNGTSSNRHNPFVMITRKGCSETQGECIGINLIYSGNHYEAAEVSEYGKVRMVSGLHFHNMNWRLAPGESFYTPEAVVSFSDKGCNGLSDQLHQFVLQHIIPPAFAEKDRPVLVNNWEATYFNFNQAKLLGLAKEAGKLGIELFVLDDGWFGEREDDTSSLGDWTVNESKLGCTLRELSEKIKREGLSFGLWMEPEMVSENSKLYREHPEWAVMVPGREAYLGRNQLLLDYTNPAVREYIKNTLTNLLKSADISYVKWDMNRPLTDAYSVEQRLGNGEFYHRYVLGLYEVFEYLTNTFPDILFEGCSAGGNRFDLGMLYYMPQIWTSDDTDPHERMMIQEGTSYGYPLSTMGAHVSCAPNHQTLRNISLETRFQVACFGDLGYELDLTKLTMAEKKIMKNQIAFYKEHRHLFQYGDFSRSRMHNGNILWQVTAKDKSEAVILAYSMRGGANKSDDIIKAVNLKSDALYQISARTCAISIKEFGNLVNQISPVNIKEEGVLQSVVNKVYTLESEKEEYQMSGAMLQYAGMKPKQRFVGTGYNEMTRVMGDDSSRLYVIKEIKEESVEEQEDGPVSEDI